MTNKFTQAVENTAKTNTPDGVIRTENVHIGPNKKATVEMYANMGSATPDEAVTLFKLAYAENPIVAWQLAFMLRDIRNGMGMRENFRAILKYAQQHKNTKNQLAKLVSFIPHVGRFDDLMSLRFSPEVREIAFEVWGNALTETGGQSALAAKWLPRKPKSNSEREFINLFRKHLGFNERRGEFRRMVAAKSKTVEQALSSKKYDDINFSHVPSQAMTKYRVAFQRNMPEAWADFTKRLISGDPTVKVNASTLFPHDVLNIQALYQCGQSKEQENLLDAQFNALPNFFPKDENGNQIPVSVLPMIDVSGSMKQSIPNSSVWAIDVAISLGMYVTNKNVGSWQGQFLTFDSNPQLLTVKDIKSPVEQYKYINASHWGMTTNLEKAAELIVKFGKKHKVPQSDMPKILLIISDMQFNSAVRHDDNKPLKMVRSIFNEAGYETPTVVFWNVTNKKNMTMKFDKNGVALLSGYSPSVLSHFLNHLDELTPEVAMSKGLQQYNYIAEALISE